MASKINAKYKSWLEISKGALKNNISEFRKIVDKKTKIMSIVKANAYGHGIIEVSQIISKYTDWFGVDSAQEALLLRENDIVSPILVLGYVPTGVVKDLIDNNISFVIYDNDLVKHIESIKLSKKAKVHLKIETGLNRQGLRDGDALKLAEKINKSKFIELEGVYTHFADVEDTLDPYFANYQLERFNKSLANLEKKGLKPTYIHTAATAAAILHKKSHFNMMRLGIGLYGLWPSREAQIADNLSIKSNMTLKPVLSFKTVIAQVKNIKAGESVGYGRLWFAPKDSKIAVIPIGYSDGYDRKLSNIGRVIVNGDYAPVIGRVAMNMFVIDVSHIKKVKRDDMVIIIGKNVKKEIKVEELATLMGTIKYEVISRLNPNLPRKLL